MNAPSDTLPVNDPDWRPAIRAVEARPHTTQDGVMLVIHDPAGWSSAALTVSPAAAIILSLMDGHHTLEDIRRSFSAQTGQLLPEPTLHKLLEALDTAHMLETPRFKKHYDGIVSNYLSAPTRPLTNPQELGLTLDRLEQDLDALFSWKPAPQNNSRIVGIIAPHLDYQRGQPCYLEAYSALAPLRHIRRFVILGTNHFGNSSSVVTTTKDFETPLGITRADVAFIEALEQRCGGALRTFEIDHRNEHSVETQVLLLQRLFGAESCTIAPFLCPNPCGPTGTAPYDGQGVDLGEFAGHLAEMLAGDEATCVIAGADLSHVGGFFGDSDELTDAFLQEVERNDLDILECVEAQDHAGFLERISSSDNPTRICSAGCIYAAMKALPQAHARVLKYHQAVDHNSQCSVSCAAVLFEVP